MTIKEIIIKVLQNYKGKDGMSLLQIRYCLPASVNEFYADYNLQKLITEGFVGIRKTDRNLSFTYYLITEGENYNENEQAVILKNLITATKP
jgi:hypothetical protein